MNSTRTFFSYLRAAEAKLKLFVILAMVSTLALAVSEIMFAHAATKYVLEFIKGGYEYVSFAKWGIPLEIKVQYYLAIALLIRTILDFLRNYLNAKVEAYSVARSRALVVNASIQLKSELFWSNKGREYFFGEVVVGSSQFIAISTHFLCSLIVTSIIAGVIAVKYPGLGLLLLAVGALVVFLSSRIKSKIVSYATLLMTENIKLNDYFQSTVKNLVYLTIKNKLNVVKMDLNSSISNVRNLAVRSVKWQNMMLVFPSIALLVLLWILSDYHEIIMGSTSGDGLLTAFYLLFRLSQQVNGVVSSVGHMSKTCPYAFEILSLESMPNESSVDGDARCHSIEIVKNTIPPDIEIAGLSFSYESLPNTSVIDDLSIEVKGGQCLVILGPSGSGKSTLLKLIVGIFKPTRGRCTIGGISGSEFIDSNTNEIGFVGSEPYLIDSTLRANLLYGSDKVVSDLELLEIIHQVELVDIFPNLESLDFKLIGKGQNLSSGQKQRLCIARALIGTPSLIILDEFTSNLDANTEAKMFKLIEKFKIKSTICLVTHSVSAVSIADLVLNIESGKIETNSLVA